MEFITSGFGSLGWATLLLCAVCYICARFGGFLLSGVLNGDLPADCGAEMSAFSLATGILCLSLAVLTAGMAGFLSRMACVLILGCFLAVPLLCPARNLCRLRQSRAVSRLPFSFKRTAFAALVLLPLALSWLQCALPPAGNDALAYHLAQPKEFILQHRIGYLPFTRESLWPYLTEMLFTLGLLIEGTTLAQLFGWIFYGLTAAAIYGYGRRFYDAAVGKIAALIFLYTPVAFAQSSQAYVDLSLAFFVFAAFGAFAISERVGERAAAVLSGLMTAAAISVKYLGLGAFGVMSLLWLVKPRKSRVFFLYAVCAALPAAVWYGRSWITLGNPVYPFFPAVFGGAGFENRIADGVGMGSGFMDFSRLLWNMTLHPRPFGGQMIGPFYLAFLPCLVFFPRTARKADLWLVLFSALFMIFIFSQSQQARFMLAACPFLAIGAALGVRRLTGGRSAVRTAALLVIGTFLLAHTAIFFYRTRDCYDVLSGRVAAADYLRSHERSFSGYSFLNDTVKAGQSVFIDGEARCFYDGRIRAVYGTVPLRIKLKKNGTDIGSFLKNAKFDYIWIVDPSDPDAENYCRSGPYREVFGYRFTEAPATFKNRIFQRYRNDRKII